MPFHVWVFEYYDKFKERGKPYGFLNLSEDDLKTRIVDRWDRGEPLTWAGETTSSTDSTIQVFLTEDEIPSNTPFSDRYKIMLAGEEVTNDWITGPAGVGVPSTSIEAGGEHESPLRDHRRVMVVYGRNLRARDAMFTFLRAMGLSPIGVGAGSRGDGRGLSAQLGRSSLSDGCWTGSGRNSHGRG